MNRNEFIKLIKSIGFKPYDNYVSYTYKEFALSLWNYYYDFWNGSNWVDYIPYNDLTLVLKLSRSIKLKELLK